MQIEHAVEELQGLYGPFTMHEKIVQKIWLHGDFAASRAELADGTPIEILDAGKWNLLGGPDFTGARLRIGGREVSGDVEIHFRTTDWAAHGHAANPAYDNVVLHVVLFPPHFPESAARRRDGSSLPTLVLLPLLHRDLEEYAADDALETLTARDEWRRFQELANRPSETVVADLRRFAQTRWARKVAYMRSRIDALGFDAAAHHSALEVLGYRRNRVPMLNAATRWPLGEWSRGGIAADVYRYLESAWRRHGVRPANQPKTRLLQYANWSSHVPNWPQRLREWGGRWNAVTLPDDTAKFRQLANLKELAHDLSVNVLADAVGGLRFHTLVCDAFLPLLCAAGERDWFDHWFHWFPGDSPDALMRALRRLEVAGVPGRPQCQGFVQGLLGWLVEQERG